MKKLIFFALVLSLALALDNGLGRVPPMGFNTWNFFFCNINETIMIQTIDAMIKLGLKDVGYNYVNIDDCWMGKQRVNGKLVPDEKRFPKGIKYIADYCHSKGFKLGIYSSAGTKTCQGLPASLDYEDVDAATWASWDVDYLKYDNCHNQGRPSLQRYTKMRDALNKTGRPIYYSICNWGEEKVWEWGAKVGNSWRTTGDINPSFKSMRDIYKKNLPLAKYAAPGGWNDPDMLEVGNGQLSPAECKTHFALWAMAKSPLLIGCDLRTVKPQLLDILKNKDVIALNQDKLGKQALCKLHCTNADFEGNATYPQYTVQELENNNYAVAVTNWNDKKIFTNIKVNYKELGLKSTSYKIRDLWYGKDIGVMESNFTVAAVSAHDTMVYRLTTI